MSSLRPSRACLALVTLSACLGPSMANQPAAAGPLSLACKLEDDAGCTGRRFIAIVDPSFPCPADPLAQPIWTTAKLFKGFVGGLPQTLGRYCVYEWTGKLKGPSACQPYGASGPGSTEIDHLKTVILPVGTAIGEDCIDTAPLQTQASFEPQADAWARDELFLRAGGVRPLPSSTVAPRPARLVAVDTSPTAANGITIGQSRHGDTVAHIARDLACPGGEAAACGAKVSTRLGLPRTDLASPLTTNTVAGGYFGTEGDLAAAIEATVSQWHDDVVVGRAEPRLVVNLSVGWEDDPERSNCALADPSLLSPPARAVADALRYASCHGALVLAAAGNDTGGMQPPSGMVCPARWEVLDAPADRLCSELVGSTFPALWAERFPRYPLRQTAGQLPAYNRLAYAVGGVDYADEPLWPARRGARPRLSGLGLLGAAWDTSSGASVTPNANGVAPSPPPFVTGTSVATAVASAIAAAVWSYDPSKTAPKVLDDIYNSGVALQRGGANIPADSGTCIGASACDVRRLSLCRAIGATGSCKDVGPADARQNPAISASLSTALSTAYSGVSLLQLPFASGSPIPHSQYPSVAASPWTFPQPTWPACPACVVQYTGASELVLYAKPSQSMSGLTIVLVDAAGGVIASRVAASAPAGVPIKVRMTGAAGGARKAWISGQTTTATGAVVSVSEQVMLTGP